MILTNFRLQVLLSTYNGEKYLAELLDSVLSQNVSKLDLLIRDDGSTDETQYLLEKYAGLKNVQILKGKNLGVVRSFFALLEASSPDAEYIAFCDQDDVWMPKQTRAARTVARKSPRGGLRFL